MENLSPLATRAPQLSQNLTPLDSREAEAMRLRAKIGRCLNTTKPQSGIAIN